MYLMTEQQHAQLVDALNLPSLKTVSMLIEQDAALAMLKAMQPVVIAEPKKTKHKITPKFKVGVLQIRED
jgi:hypothetical protein